MSNLYIFYDVTTGAFTGRTFVGTSDMLADNTPSGTAAWNAGAGLLSWETYKVDIATGELVDNIPTAPADTAEVTYAWESALRRWVPEVTLEGHKAFRRSKVQTKISNHEIAQRFATRKVLLALVEGVTPPANRVTDLQDIDAAVDLLLLKIASINNAEDLTELDAIPE